MPEFPTPAGSLLRQLKEDVAPYQGRTNHPRFFAFVPSPANYVSAVAEMLSAGLNTFCGNWLEGSAATVIERTTLKWLREMCGLNTSGGGILVGGGSQANLTGLAVARQVHVSGPGQTGLPGGLEGAVAYASDQVHSSVPRALRLLGLGPEQLVRLPSDGDYRLIPRELRQRILADRQAGLRPFVVIANAGTTNTGAVDPLEELADLCRDEGLWFHVDGAYGAAAGLVPAGRALLAGVERADSLSLDPHKWLFQPYEIGCLLVRDEGLLEQTFSISAEYLRDVQQTAGGANFQDLGVQLTRSFRALKLWMSLQYFGAAAFRGAVERGLQNARTVQELVESDPELELTTPAQLAVVTFRYRREGASEPTLATWNQQIVKDMLDEGFAMVTSTALRGRKVLRMCTINPRTTDVDLRETLARIVRYGRQAAQDVSG